MGPYRSLTPLTRSRFGATTARKQLRRHRRNRVPARRWLHAGIRTAEGYQPYFSELLILVNLSFKFVPRPLTTVMIAIEMPAAIRPYSIAVAPDWSFRKRAKSLLLEYLSHRKAGALPRRNCGPVKSTPKKRMTSSYAARKSPVRSGGIGQGLVVRDASMAERRGREVATLASGCLFAV